MNKHNWCLTYLGGLWDGNVRVEVVGSRERNGEKDGDGEVER